MAVKTSKTKKSGKAKKIETEKYFRRYLKIAPLGVALWRSVEARHLAKIDLKHPILDIGCGFGEFAEAFVDDYIDMGIDSASKDLFTAAKKKLYNNLTLGDARNMPFSDNTFSTVISISTMEHIPDVDKVFKEVYRVLKPNGIFAVTMETDKVDGNTFYRPFLKRIGLKKVSELATKGYNSMFHRVNLYSKKEWEKRITKTGLKIEKSQDIISPKIVKLYDIFILTSWPSQILKPFIGKRLVFRPEFISDILTKLFIKHVKEEEKIGTNLFVIARKPRN